MLPRVFISIFLLLASLHSAAQNPQLVWHNYTSDDGLAANEVHYCIETPDGYMWFATDNGLSRFDGYEFKNYGSREGLGNPVIFYLQLDPQGRLWMATMSGELFYMVKDSIYPFEHNNAIRALMDSVAYGIIIDFYIDQSGSKFLCLNGAGIIEFENTGAMKWHQTNNPLSDRVVLKNGQRWMTATITTVKDDLIRAIHKDKYWDHNIFPPITMYADSTYELHGLYHEKKSSPMFVKEFNNGRTMIYARKCLNEIKGTKILWSRNVPYSINYKSVYEMEGGHIYVGMQQGYGLRRYQNLDAWKNEDHKQYLIGKSVSHLFKDSKGNFWVSTTEHGIFMCANIDWSIYNKSAGLVNENVTGLAIKNKDEIFIGLRSGEIYHFNKKENSLIAFPPFTGKNVVFDLIYHRVNDELWVGKSGEGGHAYWKNSKWGQVLDRNFLSEKSTVIGKNLTLRKEGRRLWGGHSYRFGAIDLFEKKIAFDSEGAGIIEHTFAVWESEDSTVWVGNGRGLFILKDSVLIRPTPFHSSFETRVDDLTEMSDGTLVVATKGEGILLVKEDQFYQLTSTDGLTADIIENVYVDERDNIWAGTAIGLNKVSGFNWPDHPNIVIQQITTQHGLPSNEINQVEVWEEDVWVATTKGLVHFKDNLTIDTFSRPPLFSKVIVNGEELDSLGNPSFHHSQNNIVLEYLTINYQQHGQIPYRHRLLPVQKEWTETKQRSVNFSVLQPDNYRFEVQSQNQDGIWSRTTVFEFEIRKPWWLSWWAISLGTLLIVVSAIGIYKYRTSHLKKEIALQKQLATVERQALRSQMNPHFIFNSLNAIQGFIAQGDKLAANRYLSRFAKLIRAALQHSRVTKVPLDDDIRSLENYLELEQLRFQGRFDFKINVNESIAGSDIDIPPMLIQPFVENAIIHGLANKESKGQINLDYDLEDGFIIVTITDNGIGIEASKKQKEGIASSHKSVGMTVTSRRLEMLSGNGDSGRVETKELKNEEGKVRGTQVMVWMPVF